MVDSDQSGTWKRIKITIFPLLNPSDNNDLHALCISFATRLCSVHAVNRVYDHRRRTQVETLYCITQSYVG